MTTKSEHTDQEIIDMVNAIPHKSVTEPEYVWVCSVSRLVEEKGLPLTSSERRRLMVLVRRQR